MKLYLDDRELDVTPGTTIFQAASEAGVLIPHFCYHPAFAPEGSCRLCLVEVEGTGKLELSCATSVREGMRVLTRSDKVAEARRSVLEFFLAEHPLDCPICDKAGECDLQDYYEEYGLTPGVFEESKQKRDKKVALGKTLLLDRERCVLCNRCVRFLKSVTRTEELGTFGRSLGTEVGIYDETPVDNNYSGCLADLCPVGAITDTDFRFKTRAWFLERSPSICPYCSRGCNILIEHVPGLPRLSGSRRVYRVRPDPNPEVNGYWICDIGRYGYGPLDRDRLERIAARGDDGSWNAAIHFLADRIARLLTGRGPSRIGVMASSGLSNEELYLLRRIFLENLRVHKLFLIDPPAGMPDGLLLTAERSPNSRGAAEVGLKLGLPDLENLKGEIDLILLFGPGLIDRYGQGRVEALLGTIESKIIFSAQAVSNAGIFDWVLPVLPSAEKSGSFTNIDGRVQRFEPVRSACGQGLAEWEILLRLARELGLEPGFYSGLHGVEDIRRTLGLEIAFFQQRT